MTPRSRTLAKSMKIQSRRAILTAALELFATKGYSATTTETIARKAGVSKGLIFTHFASKEHLLMSIIDEALSRWMPTITSVSPTGTPREQFLTIIDAWFDLIRKEPLLVRLGLQLNMDDAFRDFVRKKGQNYIEHFFGQLRRLLKRLGSRQPELDCFLVMFFFDGVTANYTVAPELFPIEKIKNHFVDTLLAQWAPRRSATAGKPKRASMGH